MSVRHGELPGLPKLRWGRTGAHTPIYSPWCPELPAPPSLSGLSRAHMPPSPSVGLGGPKPSEGASVPGGSFCLSCRPCPPPPDCFSLRRRSCKCFVAASSCFLWKPGVPACTDSVLGAARSSRFVLMGTSPYALRVPLPSLGVSGAVAMFSPWGGSAPPVLGRLCTPSPGDSVPGTLPHLFLPDPEGHPPTLVSRPGSARPGWRGGPLLLGWTVHMLIAQT